MARDANGMGWDGMGWDGMGCVRIGLPTYAGSTRETLAVSEQQLA
jgi:hypothetical protein